jgi:hypothetical protein
MRSAVLARDRRGRHPANACAVCVKRTAGLDALCWMCWESKARATRCDATTETLVRWVARRTRKYANGGLR